MGRTTVTEHAEGRVLRSVLRLPDLIWMVIVSAEPPFRTKKNSEICGQRNNSNYRHELKPGLGGKVPKQKISTLIRRTILCIDALAVK